MSFARWVSAWIPRGRAKTLPELCTAAGRHRYSTDVEQAPLGNGLWSHYALMGWVEAFAELGVIVASREQLLAAGASGRLLSTAVKGGYLVRARRDHYVLPGTSANLIRAVRIGGRLACVSALEQANVFALDASWPHVSLDPDASRLRSPNNRFVALHDQNRDGAELHWSPLFDPDRATAHSVGLPDALAQSLRCQEPRFALASLDNALHHGLVTAGDISEVFAHSPQRLQYLKPLVNRRVEAGQETVLGWIIREAGLRYEVQVTFPGIGRVDTLVEGCLVVEADSRLAHDGWSLHVVDRNRDVDLARLGLMSLRPVYQRIMFTPHDVRDAILQLVNVHHRVR